MSKSQAGRKSLRKYELANFFFFLALIVILGLVVAIVFRIYSTPKEAISTESEEGLVSDSTSPGSDVGLFYLGAKVSETSRQYRSRMDIPVTDDGFAKELFSIPGIQEFTIDKKLIIVKKSSSANWESIRAGIKDTVRNHLHIHY